ncbi:MAG: hypothetical protein ACFFBP_13620 [Promethearchaeota archaeon]
MFTDIIEEDSEKSEIMMHVDYDKKNKIFYTNIYFPDCKYVLKTPIASLGKMFSYNECMIEKFDLLKFSYLLYY